MTLPTEPKAEELLKFQRELQEFAKTQKKDLKAKLISQVHSLSTKERRSEKTSHYALQLVKVLYDLNDIKGALYVATFISTDPERLSLQRYHRRPKYKKTGTVGKQKQKIPLEVLPSLLASTIVKIHVPPEKVLLAPPVATGTPLTTLGRYGSFVKTAFLGLLENIRTRFQKP